jgi:serine/threonine protein kinase
MHISDLVKQEYIQDNPQWFTFEVVGSPIATGFGEVFFVAESDGTQSVLKTARPEYKDLVARECSIYHELQKVNAPIPNLRGEDKLALLLEFVPHPKKYDDLFLLNAAKQLQQVHEAGYIHRDVKRSSFLQDKIIDFNLCHKDSEATVPRGGTCFPPEYYTANRFSFAGDVYCFGVMIADITSQTRFPSHKLMSGEEFLWAIPLPVHNDIVVACTKTDPAERITISEIANYFEQVTRN